MNTQPPPERLQAAADILRGTAQAAIGSPARTRYRLTVTPANAPVLVDTDRTDEPTTVVEVRATRSEPVLALLALAGSPQSGLLLADWLESHAADTDHQEPDPHALALADELLTAARTATAPPGPTQLTLRCLSSASAENVASAAPHREGHTAQQDGTTVVLRYTDPRWALNLADWAYTRGHTTEKATAALIKAL